MNIPFILRVTKKTAFWGGILISVMLVGCAVYNEKTVPTRKDLFVFLDGTANDLNSRTNVWKLYQIIKEDEKESTGAIYIEGVGTPYGKSILLRILGKALGAGMEKRILIGYKYLAENYRPGDSIYIFGFSRGAHQARALAGLISYTGIPNVRGQSGRKLKKIGNKIIELTKKENDSKHHNDWLDWEPKNMPPLEETIQQELDIETWPARVTFLGLWDTVPESSFKNFGMCKEKPGIKDGDRYKSDSYPPIEYIAHALSIDEKRTKFAPLQVCKAINEKYTIIDQMWFPGAHADVGGGYSNKDDDA